VVENLLNCRQRDAERGHARGASAAQIVKGPRRVRLHDRVDPGLDA
jgi:hypothetical protein